MTTTTETTGLTFDAALEAFIARAQAISDENTKRFGSLPYRPTLVVRNRNAKYIAIDRVDVFPDGREVSNGVHCFVVAEDGETRTLGRVRRGDVMKAASYKVPAKHARGNIFSGQDGMGAYGANYLR